MKPNLPPKFNRSCEFSSLNSPPKSRSLLRILVVGKQEAIRCSEFDFRHFATQIGPLPFSSNSFERDYPCPECCFNAHQQKLMECRHNLPECVHRLVVIQLTTGFVPDKHNYLLLFSSWVYNKLYFYCYYQFFACFVVVVVLFRVLCVVFTSVLLFYPAVPNLKRLFFKNHSNRKTFDTAIHIFLGENH